jgi:GR25 family glycosyltransferase involved in LPS biosynthesis
MAPRGKTRKLKRGGVPAGGLQDLDIFQTPVYVINLKARADRWKAFTEQDPAVQALKIHRFNAINGKALDYLHDKRIAPYSRINIMRNDRRTHREIATLGAIGASISHATVWQRIVDSGAPYAVVMEDDARFTMDQLQAINAVAKTIPPTAQIWLLGLYKPTMHYEPLTGPWSRIHSFTAMHAYVITRAAAKKLLEQVYPIDMHIDHYMSIMSILYELPMLMHEDVFIPFGGIVEKSNKARAVESNTSQHKKNGCSACHVPENLASHYRRIGPKTRSGRVVHGVLRPKLDRGILNYKNTRGGVTVEDPAENRATK